MSSADGAEVDTVVAIRTQGRANTRVCLGVKLANCRVWSDSYCYGSPSKVELGCVGWLLAKAAQDGRSKKSEEEQNNLKKGFNGRENSVRFRIRRPFNLKYSIIH